MVGGAREKRQTWHVVRSAFHSPQDLGSISDLTLSPPGRIRTHVLEGKGRWLGKLEGRVAMALGWG